MHIILITAVCFCSSLIFWIINFIYLYIRKFSPSSSTYDSKRFFPQYVWKRQDLSYGDKIVFLPIPGCDLNSETILSAVVQINKLSEISFKHKVYSKIYQQGYSKWRKGRYKRERKRNPYYANKWLKQTSIRNKGINQNVFSNFHSFTVFGKTREVNEWPKIAYIRITDSNDASFVPRLKIASFSLWKMCVLFHILFFHLLSFYLKLRQKMAIKCFEKMKTLNEKKKV